MDSWVEDGDTDNTLHSLSDEEDVVCNSSITQSSGTFALRLS